MSKVNLSQRRGVVRRNHRNVWIGMAAAVLIPIVLLYRFVTGPVSGATHTKPVPQPSAAAAAAAKPVTFSGTYFSITAPGGYRVSRHDVSKMGDETVLMVDASVPISHGMAVTIYSTASLDVSDILVRRHDPTTYKEADLNSPPGTLLFARRMENFEEVAFLRGSSHLAAVALSGGVAGDSGLEQTLLQTIKTFHWR